jgi:hypothetical protein
MTEPIKKGGSELVSGCAEVLPKHRMNCTLDPDRRLRAGWRHKAFETNFIFLLQSTQSQIGIWKSVVSNSSEAIQSAIRSFSAFSGFFCAQACDVPSTASRNVLKPRRLSAASPARIESFISETYHSGGSAR